MKRSTALVLLSVLVSSIGVLYATAEGRRWLKVMAGDQLDAALDTIAVTPGQRRALEHVKNAASAALEAKVEQLRNLLRCAVGGPSRPSGRFLLTLPSLRSLSELGDRPRAIRGWRGEAAPVLVSGRCPMRLRPLEIALLHCPALKLARESSSADRG